MTQTHEGVKFGFKQLSGYPGREFKKKKKLKDETVTLLPGWADEMIGNSLDQWRFIDNRKKNQLSDNLKEKEGENQNKIKQCQGRKSYK